MTTTQNKAETETVQTKLPPSSLGLPLLGETIQYIFDWECLRSSKIEWVHIPTLRPKDNLHVAFRRLVKTEN
jgi:hypothetical protein